MPATVTVSAASTVSYGIPRMLQCMIIRVCTAEDCSKVLDWAALAMCCVQEEKDPTAQSALLRRWGRQHHGRTLLSLSALAAMIAAEVCR
jgi:hypothetical protein